MNVTSGADLLTIKALQKWALKWSLYQRLWLRRPALENLVNPSLRRQKFCR